MEGYQFALLPLVIHIFCPLMTHLKRQNQNGLTAANGSNVAYLSPFFTAVVLAPLTSLPAANTQLFTRRRKSAGDDAHRAETTGGFGFASEG
jgi:hypothetical protein